MASHEGSHSAYIRRMRLRRRQMLQAMAVGGSVGLASFLAACAGSPPASPTTAPAAAPTAAPAAAPTAAPAAVPTSSTGAPVSSAPAPTITPAPKATGAAQLKATAAAVEGALHLNLPPTLPGGGEADSIDPGRASFNVEIEIVMRTFSNFYTFDDKAQLVLDQADAMPVVSPDGKTITVKLKKGLVWSDGKPLAAKDWVYGAKRQLNPAVAGEYAFTLYGVKGAEKYNSADPKKVSAADLKALRDAVGISAPDDTTVVYQLDNPAPWFLSVLATWNGLPVREDIITAGGKAEDNQDWTVPGKYIGNGPYILTKHEPSVQYVFQSNPKYVRGEPPLKVVQYYIIKDSTVAFAAYKAGNLDVAPISTFDKAAVDGDPTLKAQFHLSAGSGTSNLCFNTTIAPFNNVKVRQAFAAAFDRDTFANQIMKGLALPAGQFLPPGFPGHYSDIPVQKYDPAAAKKLLADAGYPDGKGLPPIKATFASTDINKLIVGAAQQMFKKTLGVEIQVDPVEPKAFSALTKKPETTPQLFRLGWLQDYPDPQDWFSTVFESSSTVFHTQWKNDQFDKLCKAADIEIDPKKRDDMYRQAAAILDQEAPVIFIYYYVNAIVIKPAVVGYKLDPFEYFFGQHSLYSMKLNR